MTLVGDLSSAGLVWLVTIVWGATVTGLLLGPGRAGWRTRVCIGSMIGMGLMSWMGLVSSLAGVTFASRWPFLLCAVIAAVTFAVGYQRGAWKSSPSSAEPPESRVALWMSRGLIVACAMPVLAIFVFGQTQPLANSDGLPIWNFKAKILLEQSLATTTVLRDPAFSYCHLGYPILVPIQIAYVWSLRGIPTDGAGAAWHAILSTLFVLFIYDSCRKRMSRLASILLTLSLCSMRIFLFQSTGQIADVVLMYGSLASIVTFLRAVNGRQAGEWIVCGLCLAGLAFVKNEGGAFAAVELALLFGLVVLRHVPWKQAASCLCAYLIPSIPWWVFSRGLPRTDERYTEQLTWQNLLVQSERIPTIALSALRLMVELSGTRGLWFLVAIAFVIALVRRRSLSVCLAFAILAGQLLAYTVAFVVTPWHLETLISMKMEMILLTAMPAVLICLIEAFAGTRGYSSEVIEESSASARIPRTATRTSRLAKNTIRSHGPVGDWTPRILGVALFGMAFFSLPGALIGLPPVIVAHLRGEQSLAPEISVRQDLQRLFSSLEKPGDVRLSYPIPSTGGATPDMVPFAELLYYSGNYELFPRRLRATSENVVINNGVDLLQAMTSAPAHWSDTLPLAGTLEVKAQPDGPPELVLTLNPRDTPAKSD